VRDHNVQVNSISPGGAYTHMTDEILHAGEERAERREIEEAEQVRITGGVAPEKQMASIRPHVAHWRVPSRRPIWHSGQVINSALHVKETW
jgi:NAD(P)-dependent dehydrogenase (short-subunit alcohol dehydrogenase family)